MGKEIGVSPPWNLAIVCKVIKFCNAGAHALKTRTWFSLGKREILRTEIFWSAVYVSIFPSVTYNTQAHCRFQVLGT